MVETLALSKHFLDGKGQTVVAVDQVSFRAEPGKITGLLGVNGAGKTTLLRMLATMIAPTSGAATVAGFDVVTHPAEVRAHIGFLSTFTALYGRLSAKETLVFFGELYGLRGTELKQRVEELIERLDMGSFQDRLCDKLSTGQKQRVGIARTLLNNPPVLFFDEPTSGLDVVTSQTVMELIEQARAAGKTVIYCTHIMSEVERLCDRVSVIHQGSVRGEGTVDELKARFSASTLEQAFLRLVEFQSDLAAGVVSA